MLLLDELVDRMVGQLGDPAVSGYFDDIEPQSLDPVARISEPDPETSSLPEALALDPFDSPMDIDAMTTTFKERDLAQRTFKQQTPGSSAGFQAAQAATMPRVTTADRFVKRMLAKEGMDYHWGYEGQPDPETGRPAWDCSGIIVDVMQSLGFDFPRTNSAGIYARSKKISLKRAINTRGAILYTEGHIAISLGNGKTIEAAGEDPGVIIGSAAGRFSAGGLLPELNFGKGGKGKGKMPKQGRLIMQQPTPQTPGLESITTPVAVFGNVMDELEAPILKRRGKTEAPSRGIKGQLYEGFMAAGREDLAKMVFTKDFDVWLRQGESGMVVDNVSKPYDGIRNYGLFQFRNLEGRDWLTQYIKGGKFTASAYQQALMVAQHFDLSVDDIHRYADEVRADTYRGWG